MVLTGERNYRNNTLKTWAINLANCISPWRTLRVCVIKFKESQYYETNIFLFFSFTMTTGEKNNKHTNKRNPD